MLEGFDLLLGCVGRNSNSDVKIIYETNETIRSLERAAMFDKNGFILMAFLFGGVVIASLSSMVRSTVKHGDPTHEFRNSGPTITSGDSRNMQIPEWVRRKHPKFRNQPRTPVTSGLASGSQEFAAGSEKTNPFMD